MPKKGCSSHHHHGKYSYHGSSYYPSYSYLYPYRYPYYNLHYGRSFVPTYNPYYSFPSNYVDRNTQNHSSQNTNQGCQKIINKKENKVMYCPNNSAIEIDTDGNTLCVCDSGSKTHSVHPQESCSLVNKCT